MPASKLGGQGHISQRCESRNDNLIADGLVNAVTSRRDVRVEISCPCMRYVMNMVTSRRDVRVEMIRF